jgi:hypothetical protein
VIARAWLGRITRLTPLVALVALVALTALTALAACAQLEPDVGPRLAGSCDNRDTDPDVGVSFSRQIRPLFNRFPGGCGCHLPSPSGPGPGTALGGLDLSSLASLRDGGFGSGPQIVIDGQPCASILYQKVSPAPPFGSRMPLDGPPFLTPEELRLLHDWIAEGAGDGVPFRTNEAL